MREKIKIKKVLLENEDPIAEMQAVVLETKQGRYTISVSPYGGIEVHCYSNDWKNKSNSINILPRSGNVVWIEMRDHDMMPGSGG